MRQGDVVAALQEVVFDCEQAPRLARFWAAALDGYDVRPYDDPEMQRLAALGLTPDTDPIVMVDGPGITLCFQQVPEPKRDKNRVHLDICSDDWRGEVERLRALGASVLAEHEQHTVMLDPEGNEFCVAVPRCSPGS
jgi:hypothetical protein